MHNVMSNNGKGACKVETELMHQLPDVKGRLVANAPLDRLCWFRTGGKAEVLFEPYDENDLVSFLRAIPTATQITVIGVGSNLLVRDGGVDGVVIRLGRQFADIRICGDRVTAGAGAMDAHVAKTAAEKGVAGLEFLVGIPGTIGGAIRMNAGAYGREMQDIFIHAHAVDRLGHIHEFNQNDMGYSYRRSVISDDMIFLKAALRGTVGQSGVIKARLKDIMATRSDSQPIGTRTGGSTFKNPDQDASKGLSAWQLIDQAGCRGLRIGGAIVSDKHCNFLINTGSATAYDIEALGEEVYKRVLDKTGIKLQWEIKRIGQPLTASGGT